MSKVRLWGREDKLVSVVIPTYRNIDFLKQWKQVFNKNNNVEIIVVHDAPETNLVLPEWAEGKIYCHKDINEDLEEDSSIIPKGSDGVRCYGFLKAQGDIIFSLDDDCYPMSIQFIKNHEKVLTREENISCFHNVLVDGLNGKWDGEPNLYVRGRPYNTRTLSPVVFSLGTWTGYYDVDAITDIIGYKPNYFTKIGVVKKGLFVPVCAMNVAFKRELIPIYYQLPPHEHYQRMHDIWSGFILKKVLDLTDKGLYVSSTSVLHKRKSNKFNNLIKEAHGIRDNEVFWKIIYNFNPEMKFNSYQEAYESLARYLIDLRIEGNSEFIKYIKIIGDGMMRWLNVCSKHEIVKCI